MMIQVFRELSLDECVDREGECPLGALLADPTAPDPEGVVYRKELTRLIRLALGQLDARERHILRNRFGLLGGEELTLEEIGRALNLSRERVRQLEREAKAKVRATLLRYGARPA